MPDAAADAMPGGAAVVSGIGVGGAFVATEAGGKEGSEAGPVGTTALAGMTIAVGGAGSGVCLEQAAKASNDSDSQPIRTRFMQESSKLATLPVGPHVAASMDRILSSAGAYARGQSRQGLAPVQPQGALR
jgi:hypothetical protein